MKGISRKELFSIPNCMGYLRILLIPVFCVIYIQADHMSDYRLAAIVLLISTVTDFLDGQVARKFHMITEWGKVLDPVADKLTHAAIAVCLVFRYPMMKYLLMLMVIKEGFMTLMGFLNLRHGRKLNGAKWFGKVCTATLFLLLLSLVLFPDIPLNTVNLLIMGEMMIMLCTLLLYIPVFRQMAAEK